MGTGNTLLGKEWLVWSLKDSSLRQKKKEVRRESQAKGIIFMNVKRCELQMSCKGVMIAETREAEREYKRQYEVLKMLLKYFLGMGVRGGLKQPYGILCLLDSLSWLLGGRWI